MQGLRAPFTATSPQTRNALVFALLGFAASCCLAAEPALAPNAPKDKPVSGQSVAPLDQAIAPYVAQARASYPQARERFLAGLPKGQAFFLVTRIYDDKGNMEQIFVAVQSISNGAVTGRVASNINRIERIRRGDGLTFQESRIIDWLITRPDGTEEGNFVGKFLDTHKTK